MQLSHSGNAKTTNLCGNGFFLPPFYFYFIKILITLFFLYDCPQPNTSPYTNYLFACFFTMLFSQLMLDIIDINCPLPSSFVLSVFRGLFGPSPTEVNANTWNSYSVYLRSPVTALDRVAPSFMVSGVVAEPTGSFFL